MNDTKKKKNSFLTHTSDDDSCELKLSTTHEFVKGYLYIKKKRSQNTCLKELSSEICSYGTTEPNFRRMS